MDDERDDQARRPRGELTRTPFNFPTAQSFEVTERTHERVRIELRSPGSRSYLFEWIAREVALRDVTPGTIAIDGEALLSDQVRTVVLDAQRFAGLGIRFRVLLDVGPVAHTVALFENLAETAENLSNLLAELLNVPLMRTESE